MRTECFVYYKPCVAYLHHKIVRKVVKSFKQDVQCVRQGLQPGVPDDDAYDRQQHKYVKSQIARLTIVLMF